MDKQSNIFVAGSDTMIGQAIARKLGEQGFTQIIETNINLTEQSKVKRFFSEHKLEYVFVAAGRSGGIGANQKYPADLMINNLLITSHIIQIAYEYGVRKLMYLASSCVYPKFTEQPMKTQDLMTDTLEPTNEAYATAKLTGIKLTQAYRQQYNQSFISVIPTNNFGIGDKFDTEDAHVISALIQKMHQAKVNNNPTVTIWGTGQARREFIYVDDLAEACIFVMQNYDQTEPINIGSGTDLSIRELATLIQQIVGYDGTLEFDTNKPDGMPLKMLDTTALQNMGWKSKISFESALQMTYNDYLHTLEG